MPLFQEVVLVRSLSGSGPEVNHLDGDYALRVPRDYYYFNIYLLCKNVYFHLRHI